MSAGSSSPTSRGRGLKCFWNSGVVLQSVWLASCLVSEIIAPLLISYNTTYCTGSASSGFPRRSRQWQCFTTCSRRLAKTQLRNWTCQKKLGLGRGLASSNAKPNEHATNVLTYM